jgi:CxxC-x17-CxxC domain-containing protein
MSSTEQGGKKRVQTRNRKPPDIVRPTAQSKPDHEHRPRPLDRKGGGNLYVGGARNEHGTRIARRVVCGRCGSEDHVPYAPKDSAKALCRSCAALVLRAYEVGTRAPTETRDETCNLCGVPFRIPLAVADDGDPLCPNCLRGFTTWSGSIDTPYAERQNRVIEARGAGVVVRKKATLDGG